MKKWEKISSEYVLNHPHMMVRKDAVRLPTGQIVDDYYVYEEKNVALVVPLTADNKFVFVKQYKHALENIFIEFPAGYLEEGEDGRTAAIRELAEETGLIASSVTPLKTLVNSPTKVRSNIHVFLALGCEPDPDRKNFQDENENIEVMEVDFEKARKMIESGEIKVSGTVAAFYAAALKLGFISGKS